MIINNLKKLILKQKCKFRISDILLLFIMLSSFFSGGENFYIKLLFPIMVLITIIKKERFYVAKHDIWLVILLGAIFTYNIFIGNLNNDVFNFLVFALSLLFLKNLLFSKIHFVSFFIFTSIIHSLIIIVQFFFFHRLRAASTFVNPNWVALWLLIALYFLIFETHLFKVSFFVRAVAIFLVLLGIVFSFSRTSVVIIFFTIFYLFIKRTLIDRKVLYLFILSVIFIFAMGVYRYNYDKKDSFSFSRLKIYKADTKMFLEHPIAGSGIKVVSKRLRNFFDGDKKGVANFSVVPRMSHSTYFEILLELGGVALLFFFLFLFWDIKHNRFLLPVFFMLIAALFNNIEKSFSLVLLFFILLSFSLIKKERIKYKKAYLYFLFFFLLYIAFFKTISFIYWNKSAKTPLDEYNYLRKAAMVTKYDPFYAEKFIEFSLIPTKGVAWDKKIYDVEQIFENARPFEKYNPKFFYLRSYFYFKILNLKNFSAFKPEVLEKAKKNIDIALNLDKKNIFYWYLKLVLSYYEKDYSRMHRISAVMEKLEPYFRGNYRIMKRIVEGKEKEEYEKKIKDINRFYIENEKHLSKYEKRILRS